MHRWSTFCREDLANRIKQTIGELRRALAQLPVAEMDLQAHVGMALFFGYLHAARPNEDDASRARRHLDAMVDHIAEVDSSPSLFGGYLGVAWSVEHLYPLLYGKEAAERVEAIDDELWLLLQQADSFPSYDLINGLVGVMVYAQERLPNRTADAILQRTVERLGTAALIDGTGVRWWTPPSTLPPGQRLICPSGYFNLGMSHGNPGIVAALSLVVAIDPHHQQAREWLVGAVRWLLDQSNPSPALLRYDAWTAPESSNNPATRAAWCYGDPGVSIALLAAARATETALWEETAIELAESVARLSVAQAGVVDAGLCHGAAGLAHYYNRFHQATGHALFAEAAMHWYERTLEWCRNGQGIGGFRAWIPDGAGVMHWAEDAGFLNGATGVGLALLAAIAPIEPEWDRLLLYNAPPGRIPPHDDETYRES
jgi:lantibiotic modifying enzyme